MPLVLPLLCYSPNPALIFPLPRTYRGHGVDRQGANVGLIYLHGDTTLDLLAPNDPARRSLGSSLPLDDHSIARNLQDSDGKSSP